MYISIKFVSIILYGLFIFIWFNWESNERSWLTENKYRKTWLKWTRLFMNTRLKRTDFQVKLVILLHKLTRIERTLVPMNKNARSWDVHYNQVWLYFGFFINEKELNQGKHGLLFCLVPDKLFWIFISYFHFIFMIFYFNVLY